MKKIIEVKVDMRTELMGVILLISDYAKDKPELIAVCNNEEYRRRVFDNFSKFKEHKTIKLINECIDKLCFNYDAPIYLILDLNEDFSYSKLGDYPFKERLESSNLILEFLDSLPKFVKDTNFVEFYKNNQDIYDEAIVQIEDLIKRHNIVNFIKDFYKQDLSNVNFIINLMFFATMCNYGTVHDNNFECNICLRKSENNKINFIDCEENCISLYVHEFSHSIVNALTSKYSKITEDLFKEIWNDMKKLAYNNAETIINEHVIRAIEIFYLKNVFSPIENGINFAKNYRDDCFMIGFKHIDYCVENIEYYYKNIEKFKNFEEFYKEFLQNFKKYLESEQGA